MNPDEIKQWLTAEEWEEYLGFMGYACVHKALDTSGVDRLIESLAATRQRSEQRRVLMAEFNKAYADGEIRIIIEGDFAIHEWLLAVAQAIEKGE